MANLIRTSGCFLLFTFFFSSFLSYLLALTDAEVSLIAHRQLLTLHDNEELPNEFEFEVDVKVTFANKALDDPKLSVVAGVDLNQADIAGYLPSEMGLMTDLALFHINSNRFCGVLPDSFSKLTLMHELDISNNRFVGSFPKVVLNWPNLKYLDIRFNDFEGCLPEEVFVKDLDALFLNNNRFGCNIPESIGNSTVSVVVFANNNFTGCIPHSIGNMANLNEIIFIGNSLGGCFPLEIGMLKNATVFDASFNQFTGNLPSTFADLKKIEDLNLENNKLTGIMPQNICNLPCLKNLTFSSNYFEGEDQACLSPSRKDIVVDDTGNCLANRPSQKSSSTCLPILSNPVDCSKDKCGGGFSTPHHKPPSPKSSTLASKAEIPPPSKPPL
ncbi:hypothetical protein GH714_016294 [Hevea brasiliensis]|uniref:Leucine-rich repeat-containing N-terminal plant-type domain-containing protein n=1 Tax=Hevea brasiliensis TaxID=3981 RepID=A0A6A6NCL5_HEVBR|nr:hypothetical protein GH714_016294 [Hevea brasiliensis]